MLVATGTVERARKQGVPLAKGLVLMRAWALSLTVRGSPVPVSAPMRRFPCPILHLHMSIPVLLSCVSVSITGPATDATAAKTQRRRTSVTLYKQSLHTSVLRRPCRPATCIGSEQPSTSQGSTQTAREQNPARHDTDSQREPRVEPCHTAAKRVSNLAG